MEHIFSYIVLAIGLLLAAWLFAFAVRLFTANKVEGSKSAARAPSLWDAVRGRARTKDDWLPDARVKGGMIYNKKKKRIEIGGRLSEDSLDRVFRSS
jgi:hypothetical protein